MKKCSSIVWKFFDRIEEDKRCVSVVCKLCDTQYKYFGNTTNLRVHLSNRHPIQWELGQNGTLDESKIQLEDADTSTPRRRRNVKAQDRNVRYSLSYDNAEIPGKMPIIEIQRVDVLEASDQDENEDATINLVRQMHADQNSDEEWLEEDPYQITHFETYEPKQKRKRMKLRKIKREVTSPTELPGFYATPKANKSILYEEQPRKDEYSVFGEYIGNKLRKFKNPRTRGNLQQLITTILWQAEYGMYDNAEAVKRVLLYSVHAPETEQNVASEFEPQMQVHTEEIVEQTDGNNQSNDSEMVTVIATETTNLQRLS
ncbi:hypothetical protein K1T71_012062 [Dendrolimus kikuchii]|uniref:Uncharacterized protein n=1 Tax=Dendrolimus kikuchii TaxID=765133 RepID=A0ACC1CKX8_9NEOP|nr:hypothetical protein K1T71_012062 [Dendrolimus kikuchii]